MENLYDIDEKINVIKETLDTLLCMSKLVKSQINDSLYHWTYIHALYETKYPLFLEENDLFISSIVGCKNDKVKIEDVINRYVNNEYLDIMFERWKQSVFINPDRMCVLNEAIQMHKNNFYYGSTCLMSTQIYGISEDIHDYLKKNDVYIDEESENIITDSYKVNPNSEKGRLLQLPGITNKSYCTIGVIIDYLKKEVLSSSDSKDRWEHQPLRNKICHGTQLNYGTKEHSIRSILNIDLLIRIGVNIIDGVDDLEDLEDDV